MISVYGASKLYHSEMWKNLRKNPEWSHVKWTARWPTDHVGQVPDEPEFARQFWLEDEQDVASADVVLVYSEPEDKLRGALVEAGMAIAFFSRVIVVGTNADYGTWQYHPQVWRVPNMEAARKLLLEWSEEQ